MGVQWVVTQPGYVKARFDVRPHHMAPNGFLHAANVIVLVDSCGFGCVFSKTEGALGFTTVWDAEAKDEPTGKAIALFRCTQMILYPKG